jgi:ankyrin repeat protein
VKYVRRLEPPLRRAVISAKDNDGNTPLHLAAKLGDYEMLDSVLGLFVFTDELPLRADPVEVTRVNDKGEAAVELAALHGHIESTMRLLLAEKMASEELLSRRREALLRFIPNMLDTFVASAMPDGQKTTAELLKWAAAADTLGHIKSLRRHSERSMLECFIVLAAGAGHLDAVQYLVEEAIDPNTCLEHIGTPLGAAAAHGRTDVMRFLLSLRNVDANIGIRRPPGDTPLMSAIRGRSAAAVSMLLNDELLQDSRLDLNRGPVCDRENQNKCGISNPLLLICELGYHDMGKMLVRRDYVDRGWLDLGVAPKNSSDRPISMACRRGHWRVVELLLQASPWVDAQAHRVFGVDDIDGEGMTPFSYACASQSPETVVLFLKSDLVKHKLVDPMSKDTRELTPLAHACKAGRTETVRLLFGSYLLKNGLLGPDDRDGHGQTPLAHACLQGYWEIVQLFLDYCLPPADEPGLVDFATVDDGEKTLFDLAAEGPNAMKTAWVLLDSRLIDRGLVDRRKVYQRMRAQIAYHSNIELTSPDTRQLVQRLEELGCM